MYLIKVVSLCIAEIMEAPLLCAFKDKWQQPTEILQILWERQTYQIYTSFHVRRKLLMFFSLTKMVSVIQWYILFLYIASQCCKCILKQIQFLNGFVNPSSALRPLCSTWKQKIQETRCQENISSLETTGLLWLSLMYHNSHTCK